MSFLAQVPKYVGALKTARARATQKDNIKRHKEQTVEDKIADEELPTTDSEVKAP